MYFDIKKRKEKKRKEKRDAGQPNTLSGVVNSKLFPFTSSSFYGLLSLLLLLHSRSLSISLVSFPSLWVSLSLFLLRASRLSLWSVSLSPPRLTDLCSPSLSVSLSPAVELRPCSSKPPTALGWGPFLMLCVPLPWKLVILPCWLLLGKSQEPQVKLGFEVLMLNLEE